MCGHIGAVTKSLNGFTAKEVDAAMALLYFDNFRGEDATSLTFIHNDGEAVLYKEASCAPDFIRDKTVQKEATRAISKGVAILGHNRKATVGGYKDEHAHPFVIEDRYIFNHNGKLQNHTKYFQTEVDSEAFGKLICPLGEDPVELGKMLSKVDAAYTCVWYDAQLHKIKVIRNSERPLWMAKTTYTTYYASESWMLEAVDKLYSLALSKPEPFVINRLYEWDLAGTDPTALTYQEVQVEKKATPPYTGGSKVQQQPTKGNGGTTRPVSGNPSRTSKSTGECDKTPLMDGCSTWNNPYLQAVEHDLDFPVMGKAQFKRQRNRIVQSLVTAWVDDILPDDWLKENAPVEKWYTAYCSEEEHPSWVFQYRFTAKDYQDACEKVEGKFISGYVGECTLENGWGVAKFLPKSKVNTPSRTLEQKVH